MTTALSESLPMIDAPEPDGVAASPDSVISSTEGTVDDVRLTERRQPSPQVPVIGGWRKALFGSLAAVFFGLGLLGIVLPGLPTTPFLLLTSYFLVRSSPRLNRKLLGSRFFGPILRDWQLQGGIRKDVKIKAVSVVALLVAATLYFSGSSASTSAIIIGLATIGVLVILRLPALEP